MFKCVMYYEMSLVHLMATRLFYTPKGGTVTGWGKTPRRAIVAADQKLPPEYRSGRLYWFRALLVLDTEGHVVKEAVVSFQGIQGSTYDSNCQQFETAPVWLPRNELWLAATGSLKPAPPRGKATYSILPHGGGEKVFA